MRQSLKLHPGSPRAAVTAIAIDVTRPRAEALLLSYQVFGAIADLRIAPVAAAARADELWRHTCFEAFVRPAPGEAYYEFNFAPSTQWAAYAFDGYRRGMRATPEIGAPRIEVDSTPDRFALQVALQLDPLPSGRWTLGLAAVIEDESGRLSYWALAHAPGKPDFHCADCFTCEI
jgi:hypothetical protein